ILMQIFNRYRKPLDTMLRSDERGRASVHFFANMLEAYYFADSTAVNKALGNLVMKCDFAGDVETILHPKNELKQLFNGFDEKLHGALIVPQLNLDHVLSNPQTCPFLRSLFAWCVRCLVRRCPIHDPELETRYELNVGIREAMTDKQ